MPAVAARLSRLDTHDGPAHGQDLFGSLLAALLREPPGDAVLVGFQAPVAMAELPAEGTLLVLLDGGSRTAEEVGQWATRVISGHQAGLLTLVLAGGGPELRAPLLAADKAAHDRNRLSVYHLERGGRLERVAGPRTPALERAAGRVASTPPLPLAEVPALIARGQKEREELANFSARLAARKARATVALVGACVLLFVLSKAWTHGGSWSIALARMGGNMHDLVLAGQVWRLLSSAFLHGSESHLLMNMIGLWSFGRFLEPMLGWRRYVILYGASALAGSLASAFIGQTELSVGASGALWGLMLAGFALSRGRKTVLPARVARQMNQQLVVLLALNVALSFMDRVDYFAHFGGGLAGLALIVAGPLAPRVVGAVDDERPWIRVLAPVTAALMAASIAAALIRYRPWVPLFVGV